MFKSTNFPRKNQTPQDKFKELESVQMPPRMVHHGSFQRHDGIQCHYHGIWIDRHDLMHFIARPVELVKVLGECLELINRLREVNYVKSDKQYAYNFIRGIRRVLENGGGRQLELGEEYLTVWRIDQNASEIDQESHYIRMDAHEAVLEAERKKPLESIGAEISAQIKAGIAEAVKQSTASLHAALSEKNSVAENRRAIEGERKKIERQLEKLAAAERLIEERESARNLEKMTRQNRNRNMSGYVYLVQSTTGAYKIGRTNDPNNRRKTFDVKLPFEVEFIHIIPTKDMYALERELHAYYADKRVNGEWFILTEDDVNDIRAIQGDNNQQSNSQENE